MTSRTPLLRAAIATLLLPAAFGALANDFPTVDRVMYVQECLRAHPGPSFEMISKCSCAVDRLAEQVKYEEYVTLATEANATTIGGERGAIMRDNASVQGDAKRYRDLQVKVKKSCLFNLEAPK